MSDKKFHIALGLISVALLFFIAIVFKSSAISLSPSQVLEQIFTLLPASVAFVYCRWRKFGKLQEAAALSWWAAWIGTVLSLPMYFAARQTFRLQDETFGAMDRMLGLPVSSIVVWLAHHPRMQFSFALGYSALIPMMLIAVLVPALAGEFVAVRRYIVGILVAVSIATPMSAFLPAAGPWTYYHYAPNALQQECANTLYLLRSGAPFVVNFDYRAGLICFPSFHVVLAVLSGMAMYSVRRLRYMAVFLATLVSLSTIATGWHYAVDSIAGLGLAVLSAFVAKRLLVAGNAGDQLVVRHALPQPISPVVLGGLRSEHE